jgi:hypothetical protein
VLEVRLGCRAPELSANRSTERDTAHRLDAARERDVDHARAHHGRGEVRRLLRRTALTVDGRRRDFERQTRRKPRGARDVERLLTDLADASSDDLSDVSRVDAGPFDRRSLYGGEQLGGMHRGEARIAAAERRSHCFDDDDVVVGESGQRNSFDRCCVGAMVVVTEPVTLGVEG